jgi:hypothetical protein
MPPVTPVALVAQDALAPTAAVALVQAQQTQERAAIVPPSPTQSDGQGGPLSAALAANSAPRARALVLERLGGSAGSQGPPPPPPPPPRPPVRQPQYTNLLQQRLVAHRLGELVMEGDGNCQFRSVSTELYGSQAHHLHVRREAVKLMRHNSAEYQVFFESQAELEAYLAEMQRPRTWGDELTLKAIAEAFSLTVHVLTSTPGLGGFYLEYKPDSLPAAFKATDRRLSHPAARHAFLTYLSPIHYNVATLLDDELRKRTSLDGLRLLQQGLGP